MPEIVRNYQYENCQGTAMKRRNYKLVKNGKRIVRTYCKFEIYMTWFQRI